MLRRGAFVQRRLLRRNGPADAALHNTNRFRVQRRDRARCRQHNPHAQRRRPVVRRGLPLVGACARKAPVSAMHYGRNHGLQRAGRDGRQPLPRERHARPLQCRASGADAGHPDPFVPSTSRPRTRPGRCSGSKGRGVALAEMRKVVARATITDAVEVCKAPNTAKALKSYSRFLSTSGHSFLLFIDRPAATRRAINLPLQIRACRA